MSPIPARPDAATVEQWAKVLYEAVYPGSPWSASMEPYMRMARAVLTLHAQKTRALREEIDHLTELLHDTQRPENWA
jgi:hypothetical protein